MKAAVAMTFVVVIGVAGAGKNTVGQLLADRFGVAYAEAAFRACAARRIIDLTGDSQVQARKDNDDATAPAPSHLVKDGGLLPLGTFRLLFVCRRLGLRWRG